MSVPPHTISEPLFYIMGHTRVLDTTQHICSQASKSGAVTTIVVQDF